jgi:hypothetical protein
MAHQPHRPMLFSGSFVTFGPGRAPGLARKLQAAPQPPGSAGVCGAMRCRLVALGSAEVCPSSEEMP